MEEEGVHALLQVAFDCRTLIIEGLQVLGASRLSVVVDIPCQGDDERAAQAYS